MFRDSFHRSALWWHRDAPLLSGAKFSCGAYHNVLMDVNIVTVM
jgi:hypothetical protein